MIPPEMTDEEIAHNFIIAEQKLDKVYHAIPEWVHREYPHLSLDEKINQGFQHQQKTWAELFLREVQDNQKVREFLIYVMGKHGHDYQTEYWAFLTQKEKTEKKKT